MSLFKALELAGGFHIRVSGIEYGRFTDLKFDHIHKNALQQIASVKLPDGWLIMTLDDSGLELDFNAISLSFRALATPSNGDDMKRFAVYKVDSVCDIEFVKTLTYLENQLEMKPSFTPVKPAEIIKSTFKRRM